jgi:molecular chaperone GrpE
LTSEGEKTGSTRKVEIQDAVDPDDIEILHDEVEDEEGGEPLNVSREESVSPVGEDLPDWLKNPDPETEEKPRKKESGKKRPKKASKSELAEHLARKNEMMQQLRQRLVETEKVVEIKEDRLMRLAAEFENYKKRTRQEWDLLKNQANAELLKDILGIIDDFDRAFEHSGDSIEHFRDGVTLIYSSLLDLLGRSGLSEIEALGRTFDPQYHEALAEIPSEDVEAGIVAEVVQKGYMLNDQVIRPARVVVSKGSG